MGRGVTSSAGAEALLHLSQDVSRALDEFVRSVRIAFGPDLDSVVLLGNEPKDADEKHGIDVVVLLNDFKGFRADQARQALKQAQAVVPFRAMFLLVGELGSATSAFAQKFGNAAQLPIVLYGSDPFQNLEVPRESNVLRLKKMLLNIVLQLREAYVQRTNSEHQLAGVIADASGPLRSAAATMLILEGVLPAELPRISLKTSSRGSLERVARELGEDSNYFSAPLLGLSSARDERSLPPGVAGPTLLGLIELASRMRGRADLLK
ncbi:MAG: hypothetical protein JWO13_2900 [Acidobacteriales bacterium]|nr:hypothetical protein [Terriglobales bacterium]